MPGILSPILGGLRRWATTTRGKCRQRPAPTGPPRRLARRLADAIDRAMALGLWEHADRLARTAASLAPGYARLAEPLARLRLAQGDPETALRVIEGCRTLPASLRLLRAACNLSLGARAEADLDLHQWSARASAPIDARLMLGLLEWRRGDDAVGTLQRNLRHLEDQRTLQALLLVSLHCGLAEQAKVWARRLRTGCAGGGRSTVRSVDLMLRSLGMAGVHPDEQPTREQVNALAMELITFEPAIKTLTEAQCRRTHLPTVQLLHEAIEQALPDLCNPAEALHALARLSMLEGDRRAALGFAERGLDENPMSAPLSLLVEQLSETTPPDDQAAATSPMPAEPAAAKGKAA
ncbi:MAG: tetratricopeptide repeat protein [Planctomycetota bacterium]